MGIRQPYMKPVSIFFVANFIFFLFPFVTSNTFSTPLQFQPRMPLFGGIAQEMIDNRLKSDNITFDELSAKYKKQSDSLAKLLIVITVFLLAVPLFLINYDRKLYFVDHLCVSFEFNAFFIFVNMIGVSIILKIFLTTARLLEYSPSFINDRFFFRLFIVTELYFFLMAIPTFYGKKGWVAVVKSVAMLFCVGIVINLYKGILFFISMLMI
jgi:hypothetical protein